MSKPVTTKFGVLASVLTILAFTPASGQDLVITGVVDGPLTGGLPKAIELCVLSDITDLSAYGLGSANNGGGSDGEEFTFPAGSVSAGMFLYVASESPGFSDFFGFAPGFTSSAANINGDDAIELFFSGSVVDVFGDINTDGTGEPWDHLDGWAYRDDGTGPDGTTFVLGNWFFSGPNALDGESTNATAATPFPIGAYSACQLPVPAPDLLLSEIVVTPTGGEFIEIYNPTVSNVDLSDVYLTDATFAGGGTYYYNIVTGTNAGGGGFSDFHARFPDGASIAPGEFQTIAIAGSDAYVAEYGFAPTYELFEDGAPDAVPDMREALPGSIAGQGGLTNAGEVVILYTWDGASDLVQDIDYAVWGDKAEAVDKTGVSVDGPDGDAVATAYLDDTAIPIQDVVAPGSHANGDSFQRIDFSEGAETQSGGNGLTGSDETSEDLSVTWAQAAVTPGAGPPVAPASWVINEISADPDSTAGDANGDGDADFSDDEFVEVINVSGAAVDISGWTLADGFTVRHTFPAGTEIPNGCGFVVFGGGAPSGSFGNMTVQTASTGSLGLNNGGDTVTLNDGVSDVAAASYGSEGGDNQSLTLDPDITGAAFVKHTVATGSGGALFSPGTKIDGSNFSGCPSSWVINEIHADPDSTAGDANGDGNTSTSQDEFVEIVNNSGADVDISGWTLADGFTVRHTFPAGSVVLEGCAVVVFGGGAPTGAFGNSLVQTASGGSLGLNNGGDSITLNDTSSDVGTASYGSDGGDNQSLTLDPDVVGALPYVKHTVATGSGGALYSPGTQIDGSQFAGCPVAAEIYEIQGAGLTSPLVGSLVTTEDNVVTALAPDGFFMQTPLARTDGDIATSDGIFVFTGGAPGVLVGDLVDVTGDVKEFFDFTEFGFGSSVVVDGSGTVPPAVPFGATLPSPDPNTPSCGLFEYECYEGMLVEIADGRVTGPNQRFNPDPIAEVHITAAPSRTFREPGIEFPGIGGFPLWDGNPEVFELDPDKLGLPNQIIPAGSSFSARGVLGFEFGGYELWPNELTVLPAPLPVPVRERAFDEYTVGSLNMFRFFDDIDDPSDFSEDGRVRDDFVVSTAEYLRRRAKFTSHILEVLDAPDILAVQEVEKLGVLEDLAADIAAVAPDVVYTSYLIEGNDVGTIDVGFMVRDTVQVDAVTQLGRSETYFNEVSGQVEILNDRPPLLLEGSYVCECDTSFDDADSGSGSDSDSDSGLDDSDSDDSDSDDSEPGCGPAASYPLKVMVVHNRSLGSIEDPTQGVRVRQKRYEQAVSIAQKVQAEQDADAGVRLMVLGDFNAFEFSDGYVDAVGQIAGTFDPDANLVCDTNACDDEVEPDLTNQTLSLDAADRYSFIFRGNAQALDHALTSQGLDAVVNGFSYGRGNADAAFDLINDDMVDLPLRSSDHDGLVVYLKTECPRTLKIGAIESLTALLPTGDPIADYRIEKAIENIADSLDSTLWLDGLRLSSKGYKVFDLEKKAVKELLKLVDDDSDGDSDSGGDSDSDSDSDGSVDPDQAEVIAEVIGLLVQADENLAGRALGEALALIEAAGCFEIDPGNECEKAVDEIGKAAESFSAALENAIGGDFDKAIDDFKKAWRQAGKALGKLD